MTSHRFHAKPLAVAIATALCLGIAAGARANDSAAVALGTEAVPAAQNDTQTTPPTNTSETKKKKPLTNAQKKAQELATIQVTGIAASQQRDLILKRYAPQIEDSITAQNIGQLPDVTISDALSRIPGVQIGRSGGEGTTVSVRGLPEVATTLNGEIFLSPGGGNGLNSNGISDLASGQPDFVDIPPTLFAGADVIKSIMASNIAGGVSGIINLRTHRPFDFKDGWTFSGTAQGDWGDRTRKLNKEGSFLVNYRTDRWGAMLTGSYSDEIIRNANPQISAYGGGEETTEQDVGFDFNGDGVIGNSLDPNKIPR
ncbi:MAG: TonB-dependent receptor plug domain-containing protein, partial [Rhodanobacteraceae bacterium]